MAGLRPEALRQFYRRLHERGETTETLAEKIGRRPETVSRVLSGSRRRGPVWRKLLPLLTADEVKLLDVAECDTWNKQRVERRPRWSEAKARMLRGRGGVAA